ncbi:hypothetical protein ACFYYB_33780 [Streptomyces sp. NPDC002886]|uniref:hypothetical protein n=1 Tax=Streptomyces sp. NPDC002886 TaxID=3364667 RepID=UPI003686FA1B
MLVSAVLGLAGIGKTELAVQTATQALTAGLVPRRDVTDLAGYDLERRLSPERALEGLLRPLGIPSEHIPGGLEDRQRLYRSVLAAYAREGRRIFVVVDNASTTAQAGPLLPTDGITAALVTSRHTLDGLDARLHDLDTLRSATKDSGAATAAGGSKGSPTAAKPLTADEARHLAEEVDKRAEYEGQDPEVIKGYAAGPWLDQQLAAAEAGRKYGTSAPPGPTNSPAVAPAVHAWAGAGRAMEPTAATHHKINPDDFGGHRPINETSSVSSRRWDSPAYAGAAHAQDSAVSSAGVAVPTPGPSLVSSAKGPGRGPRASCQRPCHPLTRKWAPATYVLGTAPRQWNPPQSTSASGSPRTTPTPRQTR